MNDSFIDVDDVYNAIINELKEQNAELLAALNDLLDEQNDAPLETRRNEWESAMAKAREAIENAEKK